MDYADKLIMFPDLFGYFYTGVKGTAEATIAGTTACSITARSTGPQSSVRRWGFQPGFYAAEGARMGAGTGASGR